jgi:hypothetical protein
MIGSTKITIPKALRVEELSVDKIIHYPFKPAKGINSVKAKVKHLLVELPKERIIQRLLTIA